MRSELSREAADYAAILAIEVGAAAPSIRRSSEAVIRALPTGSVYLLDGFQRSDFVSRMIEVLAECPRMDAHGDDFWSDVQRCLDSKTPPFQSADEIVMALEGFNCHDAQIRFFLRGLLFLQRCALLPSEIGAILGAFREEVMRILPCHELSLHPWEAELVLTQCRFSRKNGWSSRGGVSEGDYCFISLGPRVIKAKITRVQKFGETSVYSFSCT